MKTSLNLNCFTFGQIFLQEKKISQSLTKNFHLSLSLSKLHLTTGTIKQQQQQKNNILILI